MTTTGHILIVDDDRDFVAIYRDSFEGQGLSVTVAHSADEATRFLESAEAVAVDVVLLDQKLQGSGGPDTGLELIARIASLVPLAKTIVVTGYATSDAIERAFKLGVYDYLVKNGAFEALLGAKVRNALEITVERRLTALSVQARDSEIHATWTAALGATDRNRKGKLLEILIKLLFKATPGFERVETRLNNKIEEIDLVVENGSVDPVWKNAGSAYLLGECKNWSRPCDSAELRNFHAKLTTKYRRARTGFFFAPGGFTKAFHEARAEYKATDALVIPVDRDGIQRWIDATDRMETLKALHHAAVFGVAPAATP